VVRPRAAIAQPGLFFGVEAAPPTWPRDDFAVDSIVGNGFT
jgi:hypothetical protein